MGHRDTVYQTHKLFFSPQAIRLPQPASFISVTVLIAPMYAPVAVCGPLIYITAIQCSYSSAILHLFSYTYCMYDIKTLLHLSIFPRPYGLCSDVVLSFRPFLLLFLNHSLWPFSTVCMGWIKCWQFIVYTFARSHTVQPTQGNSSSEQMAQSLRITPREMGESIQAL